MWRILRGAKLICLGIIEIVLSVLRCFVGLINRMIRKFKRWRLRRATAYVNKYGYALDINSRVRVAGRAYYVLSWTRFEDIENRNEIRLDLIGVSQYKEIMRRTK